MLLGSLAFLLSVTNRCRPVSYLSFLYCLLKCSSVTLRRLNTQVVFSSWNAKIYESLPVIHQHCHVISASLLSDYNF
uniref:Secreted protein n=1 Tax=Anguilla anguilla TaxID=7936 RepID=A0A0E9PPZ0_ANGAN